MERRFRCTACGKCCRGWLPLTVRDALANAGRFPLAMVWTPIRPGHKAFEITQRLGTTVQLGKRDSLAVRILPTSYLPPTFSCPALTEDGLCGIHDHKPIRCRTMPFLALREEGDQREMLVPRPGWACDTGDTAEVVYRDRTILQREAFDQERAEFLAQLPTLRAYAERVLSTTPSLPQTLDKVSRKPGGGHVVIGFATLLRRLGREQQVGVAQAQRLVLSDMAARTAGVPALGEYHRQYLDWAGEMEREAARAGE
ncbi:MAG: YkgJ family cysteine cluster protein [Alphaproteobacteria bacterium]